MNRREFLSLITIAYITPATLINIVLKNPMEILKDLCIKTVGKDKIDEKSFDWAIEYCDKKMLESELDACGTMMDVLDFCCQRGGLNVWVEEGILVVRSQKHTEWALKWQKRLMRGNQRELEN